MRVDPLVFAVLAPTLWAAHNVGDHVVQTDHQAGAKAHDWRAMAGHLGGYQVVAVVAVGFVSAVTGLRCGRWAGLAGMVFSAGTHAFLDRRWPVRWVLERTGSPGFARLQSPVCGMYQADQALHHGCLLIAAGIMAVRRDGGGS